MINWNKVWLWTRRIFWIIAIILIAIAFLVFLPGEGFALFPDYTYLIWFIVLTVIGSSILIFFISNTVVQKIKLRNTILNSLQRNLRINDKELALEIDEPLWRVCNLFKKLANKKAKKELEFIEEWDG